MITDDQKANFLIDLTKEYYSQADDYYARKAKAGWGFGYSNDYPLQHGKGKHWVLPDKMVESLINSTKD